MTLNIEDQRFLKKHYIFENLKDDQIEYIYSKAKKINVPKDTILIEEGKQETDLYLIRKGSVEIIKGEKSSGESHSLLTLSEGEILGEISLIDHQPRSASVKILENSEFIVLPLEALTSEKIKSSFTQIIQNISQGLAKRLRSTGSLTAEALQRELTQTKIHVEVGNFLFAVLVVLVGWIFFISASERFITSIGLSSLISFPAIILFTIIWAKHMRDSQFPMKFYGFTLENWKKYMWEGLLFSLPLIVLATIFKGLLITYVPEFQNNTLFALHEKSFDRLEILTAPIYILLSAPQEFIARGSLQTTIQFALSGKHTALKAILLSNFLFASVHAMFSLLFALAAFTFGLFWGWLYYRQKSLVGCITSHALIGFWTLTVLGFTEILRRY